MAIIFRITPSETDFAVQAISGWIGWDWKSPGGVKYIAAYAKNNHDEEPQNNSHHNKPLLLLYHSLQLTLVIVIATLQW